MNILEASLFVETIVDLTPADLRSLKQWINGGPRPDALLASLPAIARDKLEHAALNMPEVRARQAARKSLKD